MSPQEHGLNYGNYGGSRIAPVAGFPAPSDPPRSNPPRPIIYGSVCSGIEAASMAWSSLGWRASFFSEIDPFCRSVLQQHYPTVPLHDDFTTIQDGDYEPIDLLVGGTPCQAFSIAGLRKGLADERGNLSLEFVRLAERLRPRWVVWENVPGVLSVDGGRAFGAFLGGLAAVGYGVAYRVLDAQFFGVPQRRRRVFVVGCFGNWRRSAAVLFERQSLSGHPPPRRKAGAATAGTIMAGADGRGWRIGADEAAVHHVVAHGEPSPMLAFGGNSRTGPVEQSMTLARGRRIDLETETFVVAPALTRNPYGDHHSREGLLVPYQTRGSVLDDGQEVTGMSGGNADRASGSAPMAFSCKDHGADAQQDISPTLRAMNHNAGHANAGGQLAVAIPILEAGARTGASSASPKAGAGIGRAGDPMFTLQAGKQHAVSIHENQRGEIRIDLAVGALSTGGGKPGQGYPAVCITGDITHTLRAEGFDASEDGTGRGQPIVAFDLRGRAGGAMPEGCHDTVNVRASSGGSSRSYLAGSGVRRLTPKECERLQGFPDGFTLVGYRGRPAADGPRYRSLGNSMAVPVMRWIGERIALVESLAVKSVSGTGPTIH